MPQPHGPRRPSPDDLARDIARRLAESGNAPRARATLRNSVVVGRLISGLMVLGTAGVIVLGIFAGVDWILDQTPDVVPQVLSAEFDSGPAGTPSPGQTNATSPDLDLMWLFGTVASEEPGGPVATTVPGFIIGVSLPPPANPGEPARGGGGSSTTQRPPRTSPIVTTTQPSTSSTSSGPTTSTPTSTTSPMPTIPATTTTTTPPTTATTVTATTIVATTTTLISETTTTLFEDTTTTCGNNGNGKGNCG